MKINKILNIIIAVSSLLLVSCEESLNILPITDKSANNFYSNEGEIESAIVGVYGKLQSSSLYGLDLIGVGEISGEDSFEEIAANDGGRFGQLDDFSTNAGNDLVGDIWRESYEAILRINTVLNRIEAINYDDNSLKKTRIGEMQFVRALIYFNLVRLYGGVPLVIQETTNPFDFFGQGRNSASEIYIQIELDLDAAIQNLPLTKTSGRPAKGAAQALLGDVHLTLGNFSEALINLGNVVNSSVYQLATSTDQIFGVANEGNSEVIFEVQFASGINGNSEGSPAASQFRPSGTTANAKGHNLPSTAFVNSFEAGDTRLNDYVDVNTIINPFYHSNKYEVSTTGPNDSGSDYFVIRYSDVLLKYAEALNETDQTSNAISELNKIRNRATLPNTSATTKEEVRDAIRNERRYELIGEGHRWFDLKRYGNAISTMNSFFSTNNLNVVIDETNLILPIPQSQIDTDPSISQNPGY
ncbi:RagB/SusD family nutrient uptake outer membrane protein [Tenacibaculum xiamenense]|uniref:RagB/SusD family nutrient uptake outer membrane protein n=1 Tax=Tenacibaculum xiamenense TaxID=1261553 RepID=UPI003893F49A